MTGASQALVAANVSPGLVPAGWAEGVLERAASVDDPAELWDAATTCAGLAQKWAGHSREKQEIKAAQMYVEIELGQRLGPNPGPQPGPGRGHKENGAHGHRFIPKERVKDLRRFYGHRDLLIEKVRNGATSRRQLLDAVQQRESGAGSRPIDNLETTPDTYSAIVIDPPWRYDNVATRGAAEDHYGTMSHAELLAMELPAADNSHLYLWVTNSFFEDGFELMRKWGFTYKTCLTWCKPQIGMGNYFRSTTEHVLFGLRGRHPTLTNNTPTHFVADRQRHSQKPDLFYDIVEANSPGPYLDMFARRRRIGWHVWGNEA